MSESQESFDSWLVRIVKDAEKWECDEQHGISPWAQSPWRWLTRVPPIPKSRFAARILAELLTRAGVEVSVGSTNERLLLLGQHQDPVIVKFSMATLPDDPFRFQQIRGRLYGAPIACFGVTPRNAYLWLVPTGIARAIGKNQHGSSVEKWLVFHPTVAPAELSAYGGTVGEGVQQFINTWGTDRAA
jgi:hypothetical protein